MEKLVSWYRHFCEEIFPRRKQEFHLLAEGQRPQWLFITCSDSRLVPDLVLGTDPGDLFITRNAGNVIPVDGRDVDGCTATIEYAIEVVGVRHVILCGHSDCGAVKAAFERKKGKSLEEMPAVSRWLDHLEPAFCHCPPVDPAEGTAAEVCALARGNVVAQMENLKRLPAIARAMLAGKISVRGWYYEILSGRIEEYDEATKRFVAWPR